MLAGEYRGPEFLHHLYPNKNNFSTRKKGQVKIVGRKKITLTSSRQQQKQRDQTPLVLREKILRQLAEIASTHRSLPRRVSFVSCVLVETPQEEQNLFERSQKHVLTPRLYQRNPHSFQIPRVHCHEQRFLASHQQRWLAQIHLHLQAVEEEKKESSGSVDRKSELLQ